MRDPVYDLLINFFLLFLALWGILALARAFRRGWRTGRRKAALRRHAGAIIHVPYTPSERRVMRRFDGARMTTDTGIWELHNGNWYSVGKDKPPLTRHERAEFDAIMATEAERDPGFAERFDAS